MNIYHYSFSQKYLSAQHCARSWEYSEKANTTPGCHNNFYIVDTHLQNNLAYFKYFI